MSEEYPFSSIYVARSRGVKRKFLYRVWAILTDYELKCFLYKLSHRSEKSLISSTWLIPEDRVKVKGKYRVLEKRDETLVLSVKRIDELEYESVSGFSRFKWRRKYGRYGVLEGVLSEYSLVYLIQVIGDKRVRVDGMRVVDVEKLAKKYFEKIRRAYANT